MILLQISSNFLCALPGMAQSQEFESAINVGGPGVDECRGVTVDASGNSYSTGRFAGTVDFDPGAGVTSLTSTGNSDVFILKLDAAKNLIWVKQVGGASADESRDIAVDATGNVYVCGSFRSTADFDPGTGVFNLVSNGQLDAFVLKLDPNGDFLWAGGWGGASLDICNSVVVDGAGNVYTGGEFRTTVDFDPGSGTFDLSSSGTGENNVFISKLDNTGNFDWAKCVGGTNFDYCTGIALDMAGNIYAVGNFASGDADFDPGTGVFLMATAGPSPDVYVLKLNAAGDFVWVSKMGDAVNNENTTAIVTDTSGHMYLTGWFRQTVDFDPGTATYFLTASGTDAFIAKYDTSGSIIWARNLGGTGVDAAYGISCDHRGNVYATGTFELTADLDPGIDPADTLNFLSNGNYDAFIVSLDSAGLLNWGTAFGGVDQESSYGIEVLSSGDVYTVGAFWGMGDFNSDTTAADTLYLTAGVMDGFVHKIDQCFKTDSLIVATACDSFSIDGIYYYTASGVYTLTLVNADGCDSMLTLQLNITPVDLAVAQNNAVLTANATGAIYQWVQCDNNNAAIPGATNQTYTATADGDYAAVITQNGCSDTTACFSVTGLTSIASDNLIAGIGMYPNPSSGCLFFDPKYSCTVGISDVGGLLLVQQDLRSGKNSIDISHLADGVYVVSIMDTSGVRIGAKKLIKLAR